MTRISAEFALPETRAARRGFDRACGTFDAASVVHELARDCLLERLPLVRLEPRCVVDLGCAAGDAAAQLHEAYPQARLLAVDSSLAMLDAARGRGGFIQPLAADAERLPLQDGSVDLIFANMLLPWCWPQRVLAEAARVLADGGLLLFATLGPESLQQLRRAWAAVDDAIHVHGCFDMHDLGDMVVASGLAEPVMDVDRIELTYTDVSRLMNDLRSCGATNVAAGRRRTLTGRRRWAGFEQALLTGRRDGRFPITIELIFGQAWGTGRALRNRPGNPGETAVAIEDIGIVRRA